MMPAMSSPVSDDPLHFTYWSDPLCVWAFVAQPVLEKLLEHLGSAGEVEYRVVPVFGSVPWRFSRGAWSAGGVSGRVAKTAEIARQFGRTDVTGEIWRHDPPASSWSPALAIKAAFRLERNGRVEPGCAARFQWRIREAFFVENRNVARRQVQLDLARACDIPIDALCEPMDDGTAMADLWEDHQDKETSKVQGSPTFAFDGGRTMLYGNVPTDVLWATVDALRRGTEMGRSAC